MNTIVISLIKQAASMLLALLQTWIDSEASATYFATECKGKPFNKAEEVKDIITSLRKLQRLRNPLDATHSCEEKECCEGK